MIGKNWRWMDEIAGIEPVKRCYSSKCCRNSRGRSSVRLQGTDRLELSRVSSRQHPSNAFAIYLSQFYFILFLYISINQDCNGICVSWIARVCQRVVSFRGIGLEKKQKWSKWLSMGRKNRERELCDRKRRK